MTQENLKVRYASRLRGSEILNIPANWRNSEAQRMYLSKACYSNIKRCAINVKLSNKLFDRMQQTLLSASPVCNYQLYAVLYR
jgi:hypothetical protein